VVAAARAFARVLVRVPEAYLIVSRIESTRPGLLVLDADGRRVDSVSLLDRDLTSARLAKWLTRAATAPARERWTLRIGGGPEDRRTAFLREVEKTPGVAEVRADRRSGEVTISLEPRALHPERLLARASARDVRLEFLEPIRVELRRAPSRAADAGPTATPSIPGAWYVSSGPPTRAYLPWLLLDPTTLKNAAPGHVADVAAWEFRFIRIPKDATGFNVAAAPLRLSGVLAVIPDIFGERERVVVRRGAIEPEPIVEAFEKAGGEAKIVR